MNDLKGLPFSKLTDMLAYSGVNKSFHVKQIMKWIYKKGIHNISEMTDISKKLRESLEKEYFVSWYEPVNVQISSDGTEKALFEFDDEQRTETVWIPDGKRATLCISTQTGCRMGCRFCQTAKTGFRRNLTAAEIVQQIIWFKLKRNVTNVVIMGMGEPLDNYDNLIDALRIMYDANALDLSFKKVTVSTCGLVPEIRRLAQENMQISLAVSLNAADNETRSRIMPINKKYPLEMLLPALVDFPFAKRQKLTFEYVLFKGVNDRDIDCDNLIKIGQKVSCKFNLICYNDNGIDGFETPDEERVRYFHERLNAAGFVASVRKSRGQDIAGACGQLSAQYKIDSF